jgi:hypothetical protein
MFPKIVGLVAVASVQCRVVGDLEMEVVQAVRQSLRRYTLKHLQTATNRKEGQGELRGKQHRSNRCEASAAWKDQHLHRREDSRFGLKLPYDWQRLCWFTK